MLASLEVYTEFVVQKYRSRPSNIAALEFGVHGILQQVEYYRSRWNIIAARFAGLL